MDLSLSLKIDFYGEDQASVDIQSNNKDTESEKYAEILLFCCYTLKTLVNLGLKHPVSISLATFLELASDHMLEMVLLDDADMPPLLVGERNIPGDKRFLCTLAVSKKHFSFDYKPKGFGIFARGVGYYCPASVQVLIKFLVKKRQTDSDFLGKLSSSAKLCSHMFAEGLSLLNYQQVATNIAEEVFTKKNESDPVDDFAAKILAWSSNAAQFMVEGSNDKELFDSNKIIDQVSYLKMIELWAYLYLHLIGRRALAKRISLEKIGPILDKLANKCFTLFIFLFLPDVKIPNKIFKTHSLFKLAFSKFIEHFGQFERLYINESEFIEHFTFEKVKKYEDENPEGTLLWEFSKSVSATCGRPLEALFVNAACLYTLGDISRLNIYSDIDTFLDSIK